MIIINNSSMIPIYEQIVNQVKQNIVDGKLKEGDVLITKMSSTINTIIKNIP